MLLGSGARPVREADVICDPIEYTLWDPQYLSTLCDSSDCYKGCLYFFICR
jgi:hypothetical protein